MSLGNFTVRFTNYLFKNKALFWAGLLLILIFLCIGITRVRFSGNIISTLPKGERFQALNRFIENRNISNQVVFSLELAKSAENYEIEGKVREFADSLGRISRGYLNDIVAIRPEVDRKVYEHLYSNFPLFIDSSYYKIIERKLAHDSVVRSLNAVFRQLSVPGSAFFKDIMLNDPLGLSAPYFMDLGSKADTGFMIEDGLLFNSGKTNVLINANMSFGSDSASANVTLYKLLEKFREGWDKQNPAYRMDYFGTFVIAAENEIQVKKDVKLTITVTLAILLLILFLYYRKAAIPFYFILTPLFSGIFALGIMGYIHPDISEISLAIGATLLGIILDYSFHFFTHLRHTRSYSIALKEISFPLVAGSFTTITAFTALCMANSPILQDFGMFAALSLLGAVVFTLLILPVILELLSFNYSSLRGEPVSIRLPRLSRKYQLAGIFSVLVLTLFFLYTSRFIEFDGKLENMSYQTNYLKNTELELTGLNSEAEKRLYFIVSDADSQNASIENYRLYNKIGDIGRQYGIKNVVSPAQFIIPRDIQKERMHQWRSFWDDKLPELLPRFKRAADSIGFSATAFAGFEDWLRGQGKGLAGQDSLLVATGLKNLISKDNGKTTFVTSFIVNNASRKTVKAELANIDGVEIFDRAELASSLLSVVKDDFNYILIVSALVVFLTLLLIYGRIEMALFTFFPMLISWIWILGIAGILNIKFNFVNIVISTFIFGLGDDYSIFITDGLLNRYRYGRRSLQSYSSAIILSAVTTIAGTGALIFAKHPAIHSVALISVLGIVCILLISLFVQPLLFDLFVQGRVDRKKPPISLLEFVVSVFEFSYWCIVCLSFYLISLVLFILPVGKNLRRYLLNCIISFFARSVIYLGIHVRKKIKGLENLDLKNPSMIIANHSSFLDILLVIMLNPKIIILVKDWVYKSPLFGIFIRAAGYLYSGSGAEENQEMIKKRFNEGYSILIFPEGARSADGKIRRFHKGAFYLSEQIGCNITPIVIYGASYVLPKGDYIVKRGTLNLKVLPAIQASDPAWGKDYRERSKNITGYFRTEHARFRQESDTTKQLWNRVFSNYIFKGPVLEWYSRIKWKLESDNYEYYDTLIGNRSRILDIGCGYGMLSFYLHYRDNRRLITAIDYDQDKIEIARNAFDKTGNLEFICADASDFDPQEPDVIFLGDILHYLEKKDQKLLLEKCSTALNHNGLIIIRDGITDVPHKHRRTRLSEKFSTKILGFNRKKSPLHFFASEEIKSFAREHQLDYQMEEQSRITSNVLFILKKKQVESPTQNI